MIGKLFGKKSNDGFYLQIDETAAEAEPQPATTPVETKPAPAPIATAALEVVAPSATATEVKSKASKSKKKTSATSVAAATPVAPPEEEPLWVKAINNATNGKVKKESQSFAADNSLPLPTPRRVPGPSMNGFLDMARQVKQ
jgi:hypothetical protein